jgi:DNA-directed RNA polymerase alpha subunit
MKTVLAISTKIQKLQSEYNKKMKELYKELEIAIHLEHLSSLNHIEINPNDMVTVLDISVRAYNVIKYMGIVTVGDLLKITESQLLKERNCGAKTRNEIKYDIFEKQLGLELPQ